MPDSNPATETPGMSTASLPIDPHRLPAPTEWFAPDAMAHLLDRPQFCPACGSDLGEFLNGIAVEYWRGEERVFFTWCGSCSWMGEVVSLSQVTILEEEH